MRQAVKHSLDAVNLLRRQHITQDDVPIALKRLARAFVARRLLATRRRERDEAERKCRTHDCEFRPAAAEGESYMHV